jgi:hypothetical protein
MLFREFILEAILLENLRMIKYQSYRLFQGLLLVLISSACSSKTEELAAHFNSNRTFYEKVRDIALESQKGNPVSNLTPKMYGEEMVELLDDFPLELSYIFTNYSVQCDSTTSYEFELLFRNVHLEFRECQDQFDYRFDSSRWEFIILDSAWVIYKEKDFI